MVQFTREEIQYDHTDPKEGVDSFEAEGGDFYYLTAEIRRLNRKIDHLRVRELLYVFMLTLYSLAIIALTVWK